MKRKVWLNPWAWFEVNDPKTMHVSEELFLKTHNLPKTLENCQQFKDALARVVKEKTPKTKIIPMDDETYPASN